jgi:septum formation protein
VLYLASRSPQRSQLLRKASVPFTVVPSTCDEAAIDAPAAQLLALDRACGKAAGADLAGRDRAAPCVVLGADTVVALGRQAIGKPADRADARRILGMLQGTTHSVITAHCCLLLAADGSRVKEARGVAIARVTMRSMTPAEIDAYVATGESDDRAGAYAIQETGDRYVVDLEGSHDTVVGLSLATVARLWREVADSPLPGYVPPTGPGSGPHRVIA